MSRPTSKSALEIHGASSPSGTSKKTGDTAAQRPEPSSEELGRFGHLVTYVRQLSSDEVFQLGVQAGIYNADGTLSDDYQEKPKRKLKKKAE